MLKINNVAFTGRLTRDPEVKYLPSGMTVATMGCAINNSYKDKSGNWIDQPTFIDVEAWDKVAEMVCEHRRSGDSVYVEGSLKMDSWEKDGKKQNKIKIKARTVTGMDRNKADDDTPRDSGNKAKAPARGKNPASDGLDFDSKPAVAALNTSLDDSDIPF